MGVSSLLSSRLGIDLSTEGERTKTGWRTGSI